MKRFTMIVALVLMVAMPTFAERVTSETAQKVATTFLNNNGAKSAQLTDLSKEAGFPNLYIFNAEQGFVVMSADDCVQPILGYSLTERFVAEDMPSNVRGWLQGYNDEIQYAIDSKMSVTAETAQLWKDLAEGNSKAAKATAVVNALVQTTWDQNGFYYYSGGQLHIFELYNNLCPYDNNAGERTVTGCVATAMAQIMKYWDYPAQGIGSHSYTPYTRPDLGVQSANFGETTYEWANMPNQLSQSSTTTQINAIATLMYHCGVSVDMMYDISSNGGSGAYSNDIPYALINYFNYKSTATYLTKSSYTDSNWIALLKSELNAGRPIEYNGSGSGGGHAFVCDGYDNNNKFHFNWGWSGQNDGFFALTSLNPGSGGSGGGSYNFTNDQNAVIGIEPASTIVPPTNLTYTLSGTQNVTLNWVGVSGASSYNVFRNGNLIGNATSTTYSDTAPYGTTSYYVRSVDSNNQMSLPSNTVTVTIDYPTPVVNDLTGSLSGNNVNLSWTAPDWCYPETPSATLTYGNGISEGNLGFNDGTNMYWGHRYLAENLTEYNNMVIYKVAFYANETGAYKIFVYKGTTSNCPQTKVLEQSINVGTTGWSDFDLSSNIIIDASKDYWVFIYDPEGRSYPATYCSYSGSYANYYASSPTSWVGTVGNAAFLIKAYITDGTYTYNLYRNGTTLATNLTTTSYIDQNRNNTASFYTVKTNYYGGETAASNGVGYALGQASISTLTLDANDQMTVTENSTLTVNGTLTNNDPANLILEEGAQLIHNSANVKATVKRNIVPYTSDDNGWYFIASPVLESITPSTVNGLLNGVYDLYYYDEPTYYWMNYRNNAFNLAYKQGYLYASNANTPLQFAGTLTPSNSSVTLSDLSHSATVLNGFNLVGNPFACNATVDKSFYITDETGSSIILADNGRQVKPCEGIFVQATISNTSVTFTKAGAKGRSLSNSFDLTLTQGRTTIDRARVQLGNEESLDKFNLSDNTSSQIYFPQNGRNFAVTSISGENELPLNFEAMRDGIYTLNIELGSLNLGYLHLIDNLTGANIDLLSTPNYTFEAKTSDHASRFRLVFDANDAETNDSFVYVANGQLYVINQGEAELQIIDVMGRILHNETITGSFDMPLNLVAGTYILRLSNANQVLTQKVIIQ
jgi:hypothetical protein